MKRVLVASPALFFLALACTSGGQPSGRSAPSRDVITAQEVADASMSTQSAYDVVQRLRPRWLRSRGGGSAGLPMLVINNVPSGDLERLRSIAAADVSEIRFISSQDATTRWGTGFVGGAIQVIMR